MKKHHQAASLIGQRCLQRRAGLTVLELLVSISIVSVLVGILLPALGMAREASRRVQCVDHLRQIGLGLHSHHNSLGSLPVGWKYDPSNQTAYGWAVPLLPFMEQSALSERIDRKKPVDDLAHTIARNTSLSMLLCPSDITEPTFMLFLASDADDPASSNSSKSADSGLPSVALVELPTANYIGVFGTIESDDEIPAPLGDGAFLENRVIRFRDFQRGTGHTFVTGERTMAQVPSTWFGVCLGGEDASARLVGSALEGINNPLADEADFSSRHPGGANFLWGDGHVSLVSQSIELKLYRQSARLRSR